MLTGKQKRFLRAKAHSMQPVFQIGKEGIHEKQLDGIMIALENQELIKVKILETCSDPKNNVALDISMYTKAEVVQIIGRTIVLYKSSENRLYKLP